MGEGVYKNEHVHGDETLLSTLNVLFSGRTDILKSNEKIKFSETSNDPALYLSSPISRNGPSKIIFQNNEILTV